ncbi:MAG: DUF2955 domain-containing protein [Verrucomicrobiales bacterium]
MFEWWDLRTARVVRLAVAATVGLAIAQIYNWPLAFLTPVIATALLEIPIPEMTLRGFLKTILYSVAMLLGGLLFVLMVQPYPVAFIVAYPLAVFLLAYNLHRGAPFVPLIMGLIALTIFPVVGLLHGGLTVIVALSVIFSVVLGLVIVEVVFGLLPDPEGGEKVELPVYQPGYHAHGARAALITTIVLSPLVITFHFLNIPSMVLVLVYGAVIAFEGNLAHGVYDTKKYLTATAIGASASFPFYFLIVAVPEFYFFLPLALVTLLLFALGRFSSSPLAPYLGSAMVAFMILISTSIGPGADLDVNILKRAFMIFFGGAYVVLAMSVVEPLVKRLWPLEH